jgi:hypothetical protein
MRPIWTDVASAICRHDIRGEVNERNQFNRQVLQCQGATLGSLRSSISPKKCHLYGISGSVKNPVRFRRNTRSTPLIWISSLPEAERSNFSFRHRVDSYRKQLRDAKKRKSCVFRATTLSRSVRLLRSAAVGRILPLEMLARRPDPII